jgi:hypothetical protein
MQEQLGFLWMGDLAALLGEYEAERETYPDFATFMPRVIDFFADLPPRIEQRLAAEAADRPGLASAEPPDGATEVSPALAELVFTFDRPMKRDEYSVMLGPGGEAAYPEVLDASFDEAGEVFTMRVKLAPGTRYGFTLNSEMGGAFQSAGGTRLAPVRYSFSTADQD